MSETDLPEPRECPFCGASDEWLKCIESKLTDDDDDPARVVLCDYCGAEGPVAQNDGDAIRRWNGDFGEDEP